MKPNSEPKAEIHTPEELLGNARDLLSMKNPKMCRGVVLEAITALEALVEKTVFNRLNQEFDSEFVEWLKDKTKMDFDNRLSLLVPLATGTKIDKSSQLWHDYKKARKVRHEVVHNGKKVSVKEAEFVVDTVGKWISQLAVTIDLERALLDLKKWVEAQPQLQIVKQQDANALVERYFSELNIGKTAIEKSVKVGQYTQHVDVFLSVGSQNVVMETKLISGSRRISNVIAGASGIVEQLRKSSESQRGCVIVFSDKTQTDLPTGIQKHLGGNIVSIVIKIPNKPSVRDRP